MAVQQITEYIRQYRDTYTRDAIEQQLLAAGYAWPDINAAWAALDAEGADYPGPAQIPGAPSDWGDDETALSYKPRRVVGSPVFWLTMLGFIVASYGVTAILFITPPRDQSGIPNFMPAWVGLVLLQVGALVVGTIAVVRGQYPLGMALLIGVLMVVIVLPVALLLIGLGLCMTPLFRGGF